MPAINLQTGVFTPAWSRKLGTAFRSPATTLSHHYEVIAPDLLLRFHTKFRHKPADSQLPRSARFRGRNRGVIFAPNLLSVSSFGALMIFAGPHSPSGLFRNPLDRSVQPVSSPKARLAIHPMVFRSPPRSFSIALWIVARNSLCLARPDYLTQLEAVSNCLSLPSPSFAF